MSFLSAVADRKCTDQLYILRTGSFLSAVAEWKCADQLYILRTGLCLFFHPLQKGNVRISCTLLRTGLCLTVTVLGFLADGYIMCSNLLPSVGLSSKHCGLWTHRAFQVTV